MSDNISYSNCALEKVMVGVFRSILHEVASLTFLQVDSLTWGSLPALYLACPSVTRQMLYNKAVLFVFVLVKDNHY